VFCSRSVILSACRSAIAPGLPFASSTLPSLSSLSIHGQLLCSPLDCRAVSPDDSCQLRSAQLLLIRVSSVCECVNFSAVSLLSRLLCSPLDCRAVSPRCLNQLRSAQSLFLLILICCVTGLLSSSKSVLIFFPAHARRIPHSQTKVSPVFPAASIYATEDLARAP
jgi:hypothetical protein